MKYSLRKQAIIAMAIIVGPMMIATGCLPSTSRPVSEKNYQPVIAAKLGNASFASDYTHKDVEFDGIFLMIYPASVNWFPSFSRYNKKGWVKVLLDGNIGLVVPKESSCANALLGMQINAPFHVWGTVIGSASGVVGSVVVVDKCKVG